MKTYVWLTFAFLGWGYYEASGGAEFQPGPGSRADTGLIAAAEAEPQAQQPALRQVAAAEMPPSGTVQHQLETALLTALRDKHTTTGSRTLSNVQTVSFAADADAAEPAPEAEPEKIVAKTIAPPLRPDDLVTEASETVELAIGPNTAAAPDASPRPRLRPRELAGAPTGVMPTISTRGEAAARFKSGRVTASRANMRMGPGTNFPVLRAMSSGAEVRILRSGPDGWVKLKSLEDGRIGWMAGNLVAGQ